MDQEVFASDAQQALMRCARQHMLPFLVGVPGGRAGLWARHQPVLAWAQRLPSLPPVHFAPGRGSGISPPAGATVTYDITFLGKAM